MVTRWLPRIPDQVDHSFRGDRLQHCFKLTVQFTAGLVSTRTVNVLPLPTSLSTLIVPPSSSSELLHNRQPQPSPLLDAALRPFGLTVFVKDGR